MSDLDQLLDIQEAARFLRVSPTSLRRWTNSGALPHVRIGRKRERRFRRGDLLALLDPAPAAQHGHPATEPGTHLCGLFASESARIAQAVRFLADGLLGGSVCHLVTPPRARPGLLRELRRRVPSLDDHLKSGRLQLSEYAPSGRAQVDRFEADLGRSQRAGAGSVCVVGDLSGGGPERGRAFKKIMDYEAEYERRIAQRFPVVTLCQYDARRLSGAEALAALEHHPDTIARPAKAVLAPGK